MNTARQLIRFFCLFLFSCAAWAQGLTAPSASVGALNATNATQVTLTTHVTLDDVIAGSVNVQKVNATGRVESIVTVLKDDGLAPDLVAGDRIYTGSAQFNEPLGVNKVVLRASAARKGVLQRVASTALEIAVLPPGVPSAPAAPNLDLVVTDPSTGNRYIADRVNACFLDATPLSIVQAIASSVGATLTGSFLSLGNCWQLALGVGSDLARVRAVIVQLKSRAEVVSAQEESVRTPSAVNCSVPTCFDPSFVRLKLSDAHMIASGEGVVVAVLDTGVDWNHATLNPGGTRVIAGPDTSVSPALPNNKIDPHGHGTHVAGIFAAAAPSAKIFAVKVCGRNSAGEFNCPVSGSVHGINAAVDQKIKIINMSMDDYSGADDLERRAIEKAQREGGMVVAAAGNRGATNPSWPAHHLGVLAVGNVNNSDRRVQLSNFSTAADRWVNVAAPGFDVNSTVPGGEGRMTGTSQASPFVAGTLALMMSANSNVPGTAAQADEYRTQLLRTAISIPEIAGQDKCPDDPCNQGLGAGRISPLAALGVMRITRSTAINAGAIQTIRISISQGSTLLYSSTITTGGQRTGCAIASSPCLVDVPFDFSKLPRGTYTINFATLESVGSYFATAQLFLPGSTFTAVLSGSAVIDSLDPSKSSFSLFAHSTRSASLNLVTGRLALP